MVRSGEMKRDPSNGRSEALVDKRLRGNLGNSSASLSKDYLASRGSVLG